MLPHDYLKKTKNIGNIMPLISQEQFLLWLRFNFIDVDEK